jgi:hypothetical protein
MATDIDIIDEAAQAAADAYRELVRRVARTRPRADRGSTG